MTQMLQEVPSSGATEDPEKLIGEICLPHTLEDLRTLFARLRNVLAASEFLARTAPLLGSENWMVRVVAFETLHQHYPQELKLHLAQKIQSEALDSGSALALVRIFYPEPEFRSYEATL